MFGVEGLHHRGALVWLLGLAGLTPAVLALPAMCNGPGHIAVWCIVLAINIREVAELG